MSPAEWRAWRVGSQVTVLGFPFGVLSGPFAVWSNGYIATEPDVDFADLPIYLIDCRARPGQSGSPVFAWFSRGDIATGADGVDYQARRTLHNFAGIYSGRINPDSDLGMVWKPLAVKELVDHTAATGAPTSMKARRHRHNIEEPRRFSLSGDNDWLA